MLVWMNPVKFFVNKFGTDIATINNRVSKKNYMWED